LKVTIKELPVGEKTAEMIDGLYWKAVSSLITTKKVPPDVRDADVYSCADSPAKLRWMSYLPGRSPVVDKATARTVAIEVAENSISAGNRKSPSSTLDTNAKIFKSELGRTSTAIVKKASYDRLTLTNAVDRAAVTSLQHVVVNSSLWVFITEYGERAPPSAVVKQYRRYLWTGINPSTVITAVREVFVRPPMTDVAKLFWKLTKSNELGTSVTSNTPQYAPPGPSKDSLTVTL